MKLKVELTFPEELKDEPIIWYLGNKFKLIFNIVEASFSTEVGWAILVLDGNEDELKKAIDFIRSKGVTIEREEKTSPGNPNPSK